MIKKILGVVATAAIALSATSAQAVGISFSANNMYLGTFSTVGQVGGFDHTPTNAGAFSENWIINVTNPLGLMSNVNFLPPDGITGFTAELVNVTSVGACSTTCASVVLGSTLATFAPAGVSNFALTTAALAPAYYALRISGTASGTSSSYSGQLLTTVPEPATMGLFGLGLAAVGFVRRRRLAA